MQKSVQQGRSVLGINNDFGKTPKKYNEDPKAFCFIEQNQKQTWRL
jgi:hypothetical protein